MTFYQLFRLADFLNANLANVVYLDIKEETSFKEAFGEFRKKVDDTRVKGQYIVVLPDDAEDRDRLYKGIKDYCKGIEDNAELVVGIDEDGFDKIVIKVNETK